LLIELKIIVVIGTHCCCLLGFAEFRIVVATRFNKL